MNKKIYSDKRFYQQKFYIKIRELFKSEKNNTVVKEATEYLKLFPNDIQVRFMRAKVYRKLNKFDEAINDLKYNLSLKMDKHSLTALYFIYYYLYMYEEAIELLPLLYETGCINAYSVSISEFVMKRQLGLDVNGKKDYINDYVRSQVFDYSTNAALSHIKNHFNDIDKNISSFNENIDLNYLFKLVRENIKNSSKVNTEEVLEIYYFGISNIGLINNIPCNFIKVIVIPNTDNVINIYPTNEVANDYISNIEIDYEKLFNKKEEKVKKFSQIDKFNNRYKRV